MEEAKYHEHTMDTPDLRPALERLLQPEAAPLDRIRDIRAALSALEIELLPTVRGAIDAGATWDEIGAAADLTPAAAKWRWQGSDGEIAARHEAGRKRSARPSSVPTALPGMSVAEAAKHLGVTAQAIYLRVTRGTLRAETVTLPDGRSYKRVFPETEPPANDHAGE